MKILIIFFLLIVGCSPVKNTSIQKLETGKVIKIVDGDTYDILLKNQTTIRIRMTGIDAPEKGMPFSKLAKNYLSLLCFEKVVSIQVTGTDRYRRSIAETYLPDGSEIGLLMIKAGYAWHFKKYSNNESLANAEIEARKNRTGLWADDTPQAPWEWRRLKKLK